jgi:hypothetical protein
MRNFLSTLLILATLLVAPAASAMERQKASNWCWAASVQDVLQKAHMYTSQEEVVVRLTGSLQNRPAYTWELAKLLNSYGMPATQAGRPGSPQELANTLAGGRILIAFVRPGSGPVGHFVVIDGLTYDGRVRLSDPATGGTRMIPLWSLYQVYGWGDAVLVG